MATLNITYRGRSADAPQALDDRISDADVRRIAVELVRSGDLPGLVVEGLARTAFDYFVVDRFADAGGAVRIYLRPKVPFGRSPTSRLSGRSPTSRLSGRSPTSRLSGGRRPTGGFSGAA